MVSEQSTNSSLLVRDNNIQIINYTKIYPNNNKRKNTIKNKTVENARTPTNRKKNNIFFNIKTEQYEKIPYYNIINNKDCNTIQTDKNKKFLIKDNNNNQINYNTLNTNIIYNNHIYPENSNNLNNKEKKDKLKIRNKIIKKNDKYLPLNLRNKKPLNSMDICGYEKKIKTINITNENFHNNGNHNILLNKNINNHNILIFKKPEMNNFLITNINLSIEQIKNILDEFCKKKNYKYSGCNKLKYIINIDNNNSFILEINHDIENKIINLYHNTGSNQITKENMNNLWFEMSKNINQ